MVIKLETFWTFFLIGLTLSTDVLGFESTCMRCESNHQCKPPKCVCCGRDMPLPASDIPQMVFFTFDDAVNTHIAGFYRQLFDSNRKNPNGCPISMTLFISHANTVYTLVREFYQKGMEIASHSVSHAHPSRATFRNEARKQKDNLARMARIPSSKIKGWRSPFLEPLGDAQPNTLQSLGYAYDATLTVARGHRGTKAPKPFTLDYGWPYECKIKPCPRRSHRGFWEVPVVSLTDYLGKYECVYVDGCNNPPPDEESAYNFLWENFLTYYRGNKAPFGINMHAAWFYHPDRLKAMDRFIQELVKLNDVYIVSVKQVIAWLQKPTSLQNIHSLDAWGCKQMNRNTSSAFHLRNTKIQQRIQEIERTNTEKQQKDLLRRHQEWHQKQEASRHVPHRHQSSHSSSSHSWRSITQPGSSWSSMERTVNTPRRNNFAWSSPAMSWQSLLTKYARIKSREQTKTTSKPQLSRAQIAKERERKQKEQERIRKQQQLAKEKRRQQEIAEMARQKQQEQIRLQKERESLAKRKAEEKRIAEEFRAEQRRIAQLKRRQEELKRIEAEKIKKEQQRQLAEQRRREEEIRRKQEEQRRKQEEQRKKLEEQKRIQEEQRRKQEEQKRIQEEQRRKQEEQKRIQEEQRRKQEEQKRIQEEQRQLEIQRKLEEQRRAEQQQRLIEEQKRRKEQQRKAEEQKRKAAVNNSNRPVANPVISKIKGYERPVTKVTSARRKLPRNNQTKRRPKKVKKTSSHKKQNFNLSAHLATSAEKQEVRLIGEPWKTWYSDGGNFRIQEPWKTWIMQKNNVKHTTNSVTTKSTTPPTQITTESSTTTAATTPTTATETATAQPKAKTTQKTKFVEDLTAKITVKDSYRQIMLPSGVILPRSGAERSKPRAMLRERITTLPPTTSTPTPTTPTTPTTTTTTTSTTTSTTMSTITTTTSAQTTTMTTPMPYHTCKQEYNCMRPKCVCETQLPPVGLTTRQIPQIVYITIEGDVNFLSYSKMRSIFTRYRKNPNGCRISGTFFASDLGSSYRLANILKRDGVEIGLNGMRTTPHKNGQEVELDIQGQLKSITHYTGITRSDIKGWRTPNMEAVGDGQYDALRNHTLYDSSLVSGRSAAENPKIFPFTLDFGWSEPCLEGSCPQNSHPGQWEVPVIPLMNMNKSSTCKYADDCAVQPKTAKETETYLMDNFNNYYLKNRAPFGIHLSQKWFYWIYNRNLSGLSRFIESLLRKKDVYIVSISKMLDWMKNPSSLKSLRSNRELLC